MKNVTTYVGIDAHKKDLFVAMLIGYQKAPVTWQLANEPNAVRRLVRKLERESPGPVQVFYEAGPCGYALQRQVTTARVRCDVVAPALIPRTPGERVKTNRRARGRRRLCVGYRSHRGAAPGIGCPIGRARRHRVVQDAGRLVAMLPRHRERGLQGFAPAGRAFGAPGPRHPPGGGEALMAAS